MTTKGCVQYPYPASYSGVKALHMTLKTTTSHMTSIILFLLYRILHEVLLNIYFIEMSEGIVPKKAFDLYSYPNHSMQIVFGHNLYMI